MEILLALAAVLLQGIFMTKAHRKKKPSLKVMRATKWRMKLLLFMYSEILIK